MIERAALPDRAKQNAIAVFRRLGEAEAEVHHVPIEKVHFHEVGAADSIADIVGACLAFDLLERGRHLCSPINVGSGTVKTEHGMLPVPAPATAAAARRQADLRARSRGGTDHAHRRGGRGHARRALRRAAADEDRAHGYGAGDHDFPEQANVLRVFSASPPAPRKPPRSR